MNIVGIILHRSFERQYSKRPEKIKNAFKKRKSTFKDFPFHPILNSHRLTGKWSGYSSINITGDIRAVYRMEGNIAIFVVIGTHDELYGR